MTGDLVGLHHAALSVRDLDASVARVRAVVRQRRLRRDDEGIEHSGVIEIPPGAILNFRDPDGIALALFWERPGSS